MDTCNQTLSDLPKFDLINSSIFQSSLACVWLTAGPCQVLSPTLKCLSSTTCSRARGKWQRLVGQVHVGLPDTPGSHDSTDGPQPCFWAFSSWQFPLWLFWQAVTSDGTGGLCLLVPVATRKALHILCLYNTVLQFPGTKVQGQW